MQEFNDHFGMLASRPVKVKHMKALMIFYISHIILRNVLLMIAEVLELNPTQGSILAGLILLVSLLWNLL